MQIGIHDVGQYETTGGIWVPKAPLDMPLFSR